MLSAIAFIIAWPVIWLIASMVINSIRVQNGHDLRHDDLFSAFMQGFMFGPIGILASFSPASKLANKSLPMLIGGVIGTLAAIDLYNCF